MTDWWTFAGLTGVVLVLLLALARLSQDAVSEGESLESTETDPTTRFSNDHREHASDSTGNPTGNPTVERPPDPTVEERDQGISDDERREIEPSPQFSTGMLLVNVAFSQGLFAVILVASAWYTGIPPIALGVDLTAVGSALAIGVVVGFALYAANAAGAVGANALGYDYDEQLRELLTPKTTIGWIVLLCAVLPIIAFFEELLFRAALIGALSTGFDISPWFLAGGSSAAFAFGHGAQGRLGILVTGVLGFALAVVFIHTNSLLAVVVAHYLVNALEFVISGALGIEWG